jgi:hypothetical protein
MASRRRQQNLPGIEPGLGDIEISLSKMDWEQINGDVDPGTYGGTIASSDGDTIELIKIQPVREYVGDKEAKDVGFPFWTRVASFDLDDLQLKNDDVQSALNYVGLDGERLEEMDPHWRAVAIADALLDYGRADEGSAGWSDDIGIPEKVKWSGGKIAGPEYLADEDDTFLREVLLDDLDIEHESFGPDKDSPTSGLRVVTRGFTVEITEWTDIEAANGEEQPEGEKIVRQYVEVELDELLDPKGKHRRAYSGDMGTSLEDLADMGDEEREDAIVSAAISYMAYYGGEEEFVDQIGD